MVNACLQSCVGSVWHNCLRALLRGEIDTLTAEDGVGAGENEAEMGVEEGVVEEVLEEVDVTLLSVGTGDDDLELLSGSICIFDTERVASRRNAAND